MLRPKSAPRRIPKWAWLWDKWLHSKHTTPAPKPAPKPKPQAVVMYDSVDVQQIPRSALAVAGYVGGHWPTFPQLVQLFPQAHRTSIAISASEDADMLDIENGDAVPAQAPAWVKRQHSLGKPRPAVYCSLSVAWQVWLRLKLAGIRRGAVRIVTAHYNGKPHRCSPLCHFGFWTRADATQYTDRALGRNLDASLCAPNFFE
jgi:hypothetical protein